MELDILISLTDGRHGRLNVQVYVLKLPKIYAVGCLCQTYLWVCCLHRFAFHKFDLLSRIYLCLLCTNQVSYFTFSVSQRNLCTSYLFHENTSCIFNFLFFLYTCCWCVQAWPSFTTLPVLCVLSFTTLLALCVFPLRLWLFPFINKYCPWDTAICELSQHVRLMTWTSWQKLFFSDVNHWIGISLSLE